MINIISDIIEPFGNFNNRFYSSGQILAVSSYISFYIGGTSEITASNRMIVASLPVFMFANAGDTIQLIRNGASNNYTIQSKVNDYEVQINVSLSITTPQYCLIRIVPNYDIIRRVLLSISVYNNINYQSYSNYNKTYGTSDLATLPLSNNNIPISSSNDPLLLLSSEHKPIDYFISDHYLGVSLINQTILFQNITVPLVTINSGVDSIFNSILESKKVVSPFFQLKYNVLHINPCYPNESTYSNQSSQYLNFEILIRRGNLYDTYGQLEFEKNTLIDNFGYFGERGDGQPPIYSPDNISINGGAGIDFNTLATQTIQFDIPVDGSLSNKLVYICFQRNVDSDFTQLDYNQSYQSNWRFTPIFSYPLLTTSHLNLPNEMVIGQCLSITTIGGNFRYLFEFNFIDFEPKNYPDGILIYLVVHDSQSTESHLLYKGKYTAPPIPPVSIMETNFEIENYYNIINEDDKTYIGLVPTMLLSLVYEFDISQLSNSKILSIEAILRDNADLMNIERLFINTSNHQYIGNIPLIDTSIATQSGTISNHILTYMRIYTSGSTMYVLVPIFQHIEDWIPLQPNAGVYYNNILPNNGQNYNYLNYLKSNLIIRITYTHNNNTYIYENNIRRIKYHNYNVIVGGNPIDSTINGIYDSNGNNVTSGYIGETYELRLNNTIPYPTEGCVSIKIINIDNDTIFNFGSFYPSSSAYSSMTYKRYIMNQVGDSYFFKISTPGQYMIVVIFNKDSSIVARRINFQISEKPLSQVQSSDVSGVCCEIIPVDKEIITSIIFTSSAPIDMYKDGILIGTIINDNYGKLYPYDTISGLNILVADFGKILIQHGEGAYVFKSGAEESDTYCLVDTYNLSHIRISADVNRVISNLDFKNNPIKFGYILNGMIKSQSLSVESEEVKFFSGKLKQIKKESANNYTVSIRKLLRNTYNEIAYYCVHADSWLISSNYHGNPLNYNNLLTLPPLSISPEWHYNTNYCSLEFDVKSKVVNYSKDC